MATVMSTQQVVEVILAMRLSPEEVSIMRGWMQNAIHPGEGQAEYALRQTFFNALSNPGVFA